MSRLLPLFVGFVCLTACFDEEPPTQDTDCHEHDDSAEPETCIDADDPRVLQYQPLDECLASLIGCDAGGEYFEDACGCGCLLEDDACRLDGDPGVISWMPLDQCLAALVGCDTGGEYYEDACGCGCYEAPEEL